MSWAAVLLSSAILAQYTPLSDLSQSAVAPPADAAAASPALSGQTGVPAMPNPASAPALPTGEDNSAYGGLGAAAPLPKGEWQGDPRGIAAPGSTSPPQIAAPTPATGGAASPASARDPFSDLPNTVQRLIELERLRSLKGNEVPSSSQTAAPPATQTPGLGTGAAAPFAAQGPALQSPAIPRVTVQQLLEQAMTLPAGTAVAGRSVTLLDVLGKVRDRSKRLQIAHAYWQLAGLVGEYRFCWGQSQTLQSISLSAIDARLLELAQQAADREVASVELAVLTAQYALAEAAGLDGASPSQLPLPKDRPHVGSYDTYYEQIFANGTSPGQTLLLHRTLPLQHQVIGVRVDAVQAANEAWQAVAQSYQAGQVDAGDLLAALHEITVQQRAWMSAVTRYNHSIADYALEIAGPETEGRQLVGILIKLSQTGPQLPAGSRGGSSSGVGPGPAEEASGDARPAAPTDAAASPGEPTLAPRRDALDLASDSPGPISSDGSAVEKGVVSPATAGTPEETVAGADANQAAAAEVAEVASSAAKPAAAASGAANLVVQSRPMVAVEEPEAEPRVQTVFRQPAVSAAKGTSRWYADLVGLPTAVQAKRLTGDLLALRQVAGPAAEAVDLEACLDGVPGARRQAVIEAYWEATHRLGEWEIYRRHGDILDSLVEAVTLGAAATVDAQARLKAAKIDAKADLLDAETRLLAAEYQLTKSCGRPLTGSWLAPKTLPHAGDIDLRLQLQPLQIVQSWPMKRLATWIPTLNRSLKDRALAVVAADGRRVEAVLAFQTRAIGFDSVLTAVDEQTQESLEFLNVLAAYNQSIAEYVTAVAPESLPQQQLVAALVVR